MIIDLTQIEDSSLPFEFTISPEDIDLDGESVRLKGDLKVTGSVTKHAAQIDVDAKVVGPAEVDCSRCLTSIQSDINSEFSVNFVFPEDFSTDRDHEVAATDLDTDVLESDRIDLNEIVRERILLELPEQVYCKPDCKGLCPKCGADRNLVDCKCEEDELDPRWAALKNLK